MKFPTRGPAALTAIAACAALSLTACEGTANNGDTPVDKKTGTVVDHVFIPANMPLKPGDEWHHQQMKLTVRYRSGSEETFPVPPSVFYTCLKYARWPQCKKDAQ
jgi:hypothetical protein